MGWDGTTLTVDFDEWSFPIPGRIKGRVRLTPAALTNRAFALDSQSRHIWWPLAPCARIEVALEEPSLSWSGTGYLDENRGSEPLEAAFENWNWSRATVGDDAVILYDILRRHGDTGQQASLALHIEPDGEVHAFDAPATQDLGPTAIWRVGRQTQSDDATRVLTTFEDTPFYSRSHIATQLLGKPTMAMHESLALNRLRSPIVKSLLPWRMPRAFWTRGPGHN